MKALVGFILSGLGIAAGVLWVVPIHEGIGNLWTMLCAVIAGIFYTRFLQHKRKERKVMQNTNESNQRKQQ